MRSSPAVPAALSQTNATDTNAAAQATTATADVSAAATAPSAVTNAAPVRATATNPMPATQRPRRSPRRSPANPPMRPASRSSNFRTCRSPPPLKTWRGRRASTICSTPRSATASPTERRRQARAHAFHPLGKHLRRTRAAGAAGQLRPATRAGQADTDWPHHHQGSRRAAAAHHPRHPAQIRQHLQHGGQRARPR